MSALASSVLAATGEAAKSGPLGLLIILVLCVICYFLFKSMSRHLKRVREDFPGQERPARSDAPPAPPAEPPATPADAPPADAPPAQQDGDDGRTA